MYIKLELPQELVHEAESFARERDTTLDELVEEALRQLLERFVTGARSTSLRLPTFGGGGPAPGVDLNRSAALLDEMERHE